VSWPVWCHFIWQFIYSGFPISGPGFRISDFESNRIIAGHQFQGAKKLMAQSLASISGPIKGVHTFVDM